MTNSTLESPVWDTVKSDFQSIFPHDIYRTWFENMQMVSQSSEVIILAVPNEFAAIWIQDNYQDLIAKRFKEAIGNPVKILIEVAADAVDASSNANTAGVEPVNRIHNHIEHSRQPAHPHIKTARGSQHATLRLNPKYTFDNFVIGAGNQLAHAACIAIGGAPAKAYNPLFLYGDTGLGKTHLMHAVAHHIQTHHASANIAYISTEKFTNEFIEAITTNTVPKFRQRYRQVDVLLIDDIHFLSGKERIQEEFFHTFNELFENQKQIFLSSDRPAGEISKLESRLVSRFQWGLVADIQPPDFETRVAILGKKARAMNLTLSEDVLQFMAERISRNVRRMEGALIKVASYASISKGRLDIELVERLLQDIFLEEAQSQITISTIQQKVADYHHLRLADMVSKRRPANIAFPRQIAMYLSRMLTSHSLQDIGENFGGRDHGTVIHACKTVENYMEQDESVRRTVDYLQKQLSSNRF